MQSIVESVLYKKYAINDGDVGETIDETLNNIQNGVSEKICKTEESKARFKEAIKQGLFIPAGRIMSNARPNNKFYYYLNCFTISIEDSMVGIYKSLLDDALIGKVGGGVGFNISHLRPKDASISAGGTSTGPLQFLRVFNESSKAICTGGARRSAHIAVMNIDHPDIEEFISCKQTPGEFTQFNLSVGITKEFVDTVKNNGNWDLKFKDKVYKTIKATDLYNKLVTSAYEHSEPGVLFLDNINNTPTSIIDGFIEECNPCGEIVMPPYNCCCLGSINFSKFVNNPFTSNASVEWDKLADTIYTGIEFLNDVIDITLYPTEQHKQNSLNTRRIGLGFMGYADMLIKMNLVYGSEESKQFTEELAKFFHEKSILASEKLATIYGPFPAYNKQCKFKPRRNLTVNTIAPTGTTAIAFGNNCSSGIEPNFLLSYKRNVKNPDGVTFTEIDTYAAIAEEIKDCTEEQKNFVDKALNTTAPLVQPKDAIDIQAIWQKYIDNSISKTLNFDGKYLNLDGYKNLWLYAHDKGLKGWTTFNTSGSREALLKSSETVTHTDCFGVSRPQDVECEIYEITVDWKPMLVLLGIMCGKPYEVFAYDNFNPVTNEKLVDINKAKTGKIRRIKSGHYQLIVKYDDGVDTVAIENITTQFNETQSVLSRLISMSLRSEIELQFLCDQLNKTRNFNSFSKAVSRIIKRFIKEGEKVKIEGSSKCPDCGEHLVYKEGCISCPSCSWSKCS